MPKWKNLAGQRFGRLTVLLDGGSDHHGTRQWECRCDCGNSHIARGSSLYSGHTQSCGCLHVEKSAEARTVHGQSPRGHKNSVYNAWLSMKQRCYNPKNPRYKNYGKRGISVCKRWLNSFQAFADDMGPKPPGLTLERTNNDKGYCKSNCVWASYADQSANQRRPILTWLLVRKIRVLLSAGEKQKTIALRFGTTQSNISCIKLNKIWVE